jgi:hypothetical protein
MISYYRTVREVAKRIGSAIDHSVDALAEGRVQQEPAMTDRMLGAIEESLRGFQAHGICWHAYTFPDHGRGAQEKQYGSDFAGVLNVELPDYQVSKGFLAQAKLVRNGRIDDLPGLQEQCRKMLNHTPESFVFLYDTKGVRVVPAISVIGCPLSPLELYTQSAQRFFEEHLKCFIGDGAIQSATPSGIAILREQYAARSVIMILGRPVGCELWPTDERHQNG